VDNYDISRSELESLIDEWVIGRNACRNRQILKSRLCDGLTYEQLADRYQLSERQLKNIVYRYDKILWKKKR